MTKNLLPAMAVATACLISCNKDYNPGPPAVSNYTIDSAMSGLAVVPKTVTINISSGGSFMGTSGTKYTFPPNAFVTAAGVSVTGNVTVQVSEYLRKSDMLFSNVLPVSNGEPLLSGGEINVEATQGTTKLQMAPNTTFRADMPMKGINGAGMGLFAGVRDPQTKNVIWKPIEDSAHHTGIVTNALDTISIVSNTLQMCNADRFMTNPDFQTFTVTATNGTDTIPDNAIKAYTLYDNYNGVWPLGLTGSLYHSVFQEHHVPKIPVHFAVLGTLNGLFYGGILGATPETGKNYIVNLSKTTPAEFKKLLEAL